MSFAINKRALIAAIAALAVLGAVVAITMLGGSTPASADGEEPASIDRFSVLHPTQPGDIAELPDKAKTWIAAMEATPFEGGKVASLGTARVDGEDVVVVGVGGNICAYAVGSGLSACGSEEMVERGEIFAVSPKGCDAYTVVGILPDGTDRLSIDRGADGATDGFVSVASNVYVGTFDAVDTVVRSEDGNVNTELPLASYRSMNDSCG